MPTAVLTPFTSDSAVELGNQQWRKRLLPVGDVEYKGRMLHFTAPYLAGLVSAFRQRAYDLVPLQFADGQNSHTNDPERYRGEVTGMDLQPDGLYVTVQATDAGSKVLEENPKLGISARIVENYDRSDGRKFPAAVQHVLGTLDPRIPGLGAWEPVEAAGAPDMTLDLSGEQFVPVKDKEGGGMPDQDEARAAKLQQLLDLPEDKLDRLLRIGSLPDLSDEDLRALNGGEGSGEMSDDELADLIASLPEAELEKLEQEFRDEMQAAGAETGLTAEAQMALDMANYKADENERQLAIVRAHLDEEQFKSERSRLAADMGIPPYITDMARPLLEGSGKVVELANGSGVDAGQVMRSVLTEMSRVTRMLDLGPEMGTALDLSGEQEQQQTAARDDIVSRFKSQVGL
jgi:hypothetical protein